MSETKPPTRTTSTRTYAFGSFSLDLDRTRLMRDHQEIKLRPNIDDHDYDVKMRSIKRFFEEGDKVKVTLRFKGREMAHQEIGMQLLMKVKEETGKIAKV